jgi:hypothetical protein
MSMSIQIITFTIQLNILFFSQVEGMQSMRWWKPFRTRQIARRH